MLRIPDKEIGRTVESIVLDLVTVGAWEAEAPGWILARRAGL